MTRTSREGAGETKITSHVFERDDLDEALGTPSGTGAPPKRHTMPARLIERAPVIRRTGLPRVDGRRVVAVSEPLDRSTHADELRKLLGRRRRAISSQPVMPEPNRFPRCRPTEIPSTPSSSNSVPAAGISSPRPCCAATGSATTNAPTRRSRSSGPTRPLRSRWATPATSNPARCSR